MKAALITDVSRLEYADIPCPEPADDEVVVEVALTGVCGSDVPRYLAGQIHVFPQVLGHEFSGTVVAAGAKADSTLVGKRVAGIPLVPCMECENCRSGDYALCGSYSFIGSRRQGSMAQFVAVPQANVLEIDDKVSMMDAAFFEPAAVALHGIHLTDLDTRPHSRVVVIGAGTIGILLAQALRAYDVDQVTLIGRSRQRLETARSAGLTDIIDSSESAGKARIQKIIDERTTMYVFDAVGAPATIADAIEIAGPGACVCLVGTPREPVQMSAQKWELINRKELTLKGSWMSYSLPWPGTEWREAEKLFASGILTIPEKMVDTIYPLKRAQEAFERFRDPKTVCGKILIDSKG